jgi:hypothetical protein
MEAALNTLKLSGFLLLGLLSCTSPKPPPPAAKATVNPPTAKEAVDPDLTPPQTVRSERVQNDNRGVKTLTLPSF